MAKGSLPPVPLLVSPGGVREDVNPTGVPEGTFLSASNFLTRQGVGRSRPGYTQIGSTLPAANRVMGFGVRA